MQKPKHRSSIYCTDEDKIKLERLGKFFDLGDNKNEIIRRCIQEMYKLIEHLKEGDSVCIRDKEGQFREVIL
jgi:hypothetical protein